MSTEGTSRRHHLLELAAAVRALVSAVVTTGVAAQVLPPVTNEVRRLAARLSEQRHPGPYSGLLGEIDLNDPHSYTPLTPMAGMFNPIAPPLRLGVENGRAVGRVRFGREHTGPPGLAHGGSLASVCDQVVGVAAWTAGLRAFTTSMTVRFLRAVPLDTELDVEARLEEAADGSVRAHASIRLDGREHVTAVADLKVVELSAANRDG